jgi:hypothetical protein
VFPHGCNELTTGEPSPTTVPVRHVAANRADACVKPPNIEVIGPFWPAANVVRSGGCVDFATKWVLAPIQARR